MFVLASAFVAFQGWPQVDGQTAPVLVSVPHVSAPGGTRASRALSATTAAPTGRASGHGAGAAGLGRATHGNPTHVSRGSDRTTNGPVSRAQGTQTDHHNSPTPTPRTCTSGCSQSSHSGSGPVPSTVRKTIQSATGSAGSAVGTAVSTVKKVLPGAKGGGGSVGGVVKTVVSGTTGGVVTTATNAVKSLTSGLP